jgi:hypothetical protein
MFPFYTVIKIVKPKEGGEYLKNKTEFKIKKTDKVKKNYTSYVD